jgi:hypothetical protein
MALAIAIGCALVSAREALAVDIVGTQNSALSQPMVHGLLQRFGDSQPLTVSSSGISSFDIPAYLDTGTSGILISPDTAGVLGLNITPGVAFSDVGVAGNDNFNVSESIVIRVARTPFADLDNPATFTTAYDHSFGPLRTQVGPVPAPTDPNLQFDIFGMPTMAGKVVVMDPKPLNDLSGDMNTYLYHPATPFNPAQAATDPGIPTTSHHVALSYGQFDRFTQLTPANSPSPNLSHNPFIGPNPVAKLDLNPPPDSTPPVSVDLNGLHATGSFLLDTGAAASFISMALADSLHVRYVPGTFGTDTPKLEMFDPADRAAPGIPIASQFSLAIGGIGGTLMVSGFYLDDLVLHTLEGNLNDADPRNIRYVGAPVLVNDVNVLDPGTRQSLTLDGVFGMNFMVASLFVDGQDFGDGATGPFNWVTFDEPNGILGLDIANVPEPDTLALLASGAVFLAAYSWRRRWVTKTALAS